MSLDPAGTGRKRWSNGWKTALNAFEITFDGRLSAERKLEPRSTVTPKDSQACRDQLCVVFTNKVRCVTVRCLGLVQLAAARSSNIIMFVHFSCLK
jgi:hypothetical protein